MNKPPLVEPLYSLVFPTLIIFVVLGFWHGPSWNYVLFGAMHGVFIVVNNLWRKIYPPSSKRNKETTRPNYAGWLLTFVAVNASFVMFRADSIDTATAIYQGMLGLNGLRGAAPIFKTGIDALLAALLLAASLCIVLLLPSTATLTPEGKKSADSRPLLARSWAPVLLGVLFVTSVLQINKTSPFLYFQF
jgi:alginate O-acetyltransferase complex protein AlgI